jgi:hypothetical protein
VEPHQARDQQFVAQLVRLVVVADVFDRVVQQKGIAGWAVDHAVQDVRYYFALGLGVRFEGYWWWLGELGRVVMLTTKFPDFLSAARAKFSPYKSWYTRSTSRK